MYLPQEFIRFYLGEWEYHPKITGIYMRAGNGTQILQDGRVYDGFWKNHLYDTTDQDGKSQLGKGQLYDSHEAFDQKRSPNYSGHWKCGKRHGHGILRWKTSSSKHGRGGVTKVYEGHFQDDLFHGK